MVVAHAREVHLDREEERDRREHAPRRVHAGEDHELRGEDADDQRHRHDVDRMTEDAAEERTPQSSRSAHGANLVAALPGRQASAARR
jgi:hypothetical protein